MARETSDRPTESAATEMRGPSGKEDLRPELPDDRQAATGPDGDVTGGRRAIVFPLLAPLAALAVTVATVCGLQLFLVGSPGLEVDVRALAGDVDPLGEIDFSTPNTGVVRFARTDLQVGREQELQFYSAGAREKAARLAPAGNSLGIGVSMAQAAAPEGNNPLEQRTLNQKAPEPQAVPSYWPVAERTVQTAAPRRASGGLVSAIQGIVQQISDVPRLRLGDAVLSLTTPGGVSVFNAIVHPSSDGALAAIALDRDALDIVVPGAVAAALLKADDLGLARLTIAQALSDSEISVVPERWRAAVLSGIDRVADYLGHVRRIDVLIQPGPPTTGGTVALQSLGPWVGLVRRQVAVRLPVADAAEFIPLRVVATTGETTGSDANPAATGASSTAAAPRILDPSALAPTAAMAPGSSILPTLAGFAALLVFAAAGALAADRRRYALRPLGEIPAAIRVLVAFAVPVAVVWVAWLSWSTGLNWTPEGLPDTLGWRQPAAVYALLVGAGSIAGYAWSANAFKPLAAPETPPEREQLRSTLIRDVPIEDWARQDRLGFRNLVLALARFLDNRDTVPPLVLAITGPWGSGKSSVMRMLQKELDGTGRFHFAWFNAWQYREQDQILAAFLRTIGRELSRKQGLGFMARIAWVRLSTASYWQLMKYATPVLALLAAVKLPGLWDTDGSGEAAKAGGSATADGDGFVGTALEVLRYLVGLFGAGGMLGLLRWVQPFQKPLSELLTPPTSSSTSMLDRFHSEFNLFRRAVGDAKFLIFVDDLDRCPPEAVVEVLKTINLIATTEDGPGKTFFVLGFDWNYILKSIEMHFEKFIGEGVSANERFGRQYLKKIVTLPISVPKPSPERLAGFVGALESGTGTARMPGDDDRRDADEAGLLAHTSARVRQFTRRPFNVVATLLVTLVAAVAISNLVEERLSQKVPEKAAVSETQPGGTGTEEVIRTVPLRPVVTVTVAQPEPSDEDWSVALGALIAVVGLGAAILAGVNLVAASRRRVAIPPEPHDSGEFVDAVRNLAARMPANPRDVIRLVNMMRVAHLVQSPSALKPLLIDRQDAGPRDIFSGTPLPAEVSTKLALLYYRWADLLDVDKLENDLIPALDRKLGFDAMAQDERIGRWARNLRAALDEIPGGEELFSDRSTVLRFVEIYRHLLHAEPIAEDEDEEEAEPAASQ